MTWPVSVTVAEVDKSETLPVVPDAWILVERVGKCGKVTFPVLLEIDRGTMYRQRFKRHVRSRIEFVRNVELMRRDEGSDDRVRDDRGEG